MRQKCLLRVELNIDGGSVYVSVSPSDSVHSIKDKLETLTGIPTSLQTLYYAANPLSDCMHLHEFAALNTTTDLSLDVPIKGGANKQSSAFDVINFYDITTEDCFETSDFAADGPDYTGVCKGLSIEAKCNNSCCESVENGNHVFINKGMFTESNGRCSIRTEIEKMTCPACYHEIDSSNWKNIVFTNCNAKIEWKLVSGRSGEIEFKVPIDKFKRAKTAEEMIQYRYLDVILT